MINKILNLKNKLCTKEEIETLIQDLLEANEARYYFIASYFIDRVNTEEIQNALINTNDERYIQFYFRQVKNVNKELFFNKILEFNDAKTIFYSLYDRRDLTDNYYLKGINKLIELEAKKYLGLTFYYYFNILKRYNEEIFNILKYLIPEITINNHSRVLETYHEKTKEKPIEYKYETPNKYIGHKGYIPDIIVCHISFDYGRIINLFYDEKNEVSSHYAVSRTGDYKQFVSLENSAWANGTSLKENSDVYYSFAKSDIVRHRATNANYYTFSIEHESFDGSLTEAQYQTSLKLMCNIIDYLKETYNYDFIIDKEHIIGHIDVNPLVRVSCPGIYFPTDRFIKDLRKIYRKEWDYECSRNNVFC